MSWNLKAYYKRRLTFERGTIIKDPGGRINIALVYPNTYYVGMSNLGFLSLYGWLNGYSDLVAERVFLPDDYEIPLYEKSGAEAMSLETQRPVSSFDALAFSISFENDYLNILKILKLARIPSLNMARSPGHPLILGGGVATMLNPEPIAAFFDLILIGEAEALLPDLVEFLREYSSAGINNKQILQNVGKRSGFYVPANYEVAYDRDGRISNFIPKFGSPERIVRVRANPQTSSPPLSSITTTETEFSEMALIEIGRACGRGCRFCAAGYVYRPPRYLDPSRALSAINQLLDTNARIGLISPGIGDTPYITDLLDVIEKRGGRVSLSSVRADSLDESILDSLIKMGQRSLAIAPEAGSERLRRVLNKDLSEDKILEATLKMSHAGLKIIKLYFMIGLPTEETADVEAIVALVKKIRHSLFKNRPHKQVLPIVNLSVACFVPKPHTPFQWEVLDRVNNLKRKLAYLRTTVGKVKGATIHFEPPKWAYIQALLSLGDRRVSTILANRVEKENSWTDAFTQSDINPDFFVYRQRAFEEILPWDFIDHGIKKDFLIREYHRALAGKSTPPCNTEHCRRCGIC